MRAYKKYPGVTQSWLKVFICFWFSLVKIFNYLKIEERKSVEMEIPKCQKDTDLRGEDLNATGQLVILSLRGLSRRHHKLTLPGPLGRKGSVNNNQPAYTGSTTGLSLHTHLQVGTTEVF